LLYTRLARQRQIKSKERFHGRVWASCQSSAPAAWRKEVCCSVLPVAIYHPPRLFHPWMKYSDPEDSLAVHSGPTCSPWSFRLFVLRKIKIASDYSPWLSLAPCVLWKSRSIFQVDISLPVQAQICLATPCNSPSMGLNRGTGRRRALQHFKPVIVALGMVCMICASKHSERQS